MRRHTGALRSVTAAGRADRYGRKNSSGGDSEMSDPHATMPTWRSLVRSTAQPLAEGNPSPVHSNAPVNVVVALPTDYELTAQANKALLRLLLAAHERQQQRRNAA